MIENLSKILTILLRLMLPACDATCKTSRGYFHVLNLIIKPFDETYMAGKGEGGGGISVKPLINSRVLLSILVSCHQLLVLSSTLVYYHQLPCIIIRSFVLSSTLVYYHQLLCTIINSRVLSSTLVYYHQLQCTIISSCVLSSSLVYYHQLLCTIINSRVLSSTLVYYHQLSCTIINSCVLSSALVHYRYDLPLLVSQTFISCRIRYLIVNDMFHMEIFHKIKTDE